MSGLEVVGVVLGSIPLIISALENYQSGADRIAKFRNYEEVLQRYAIRLETEQTLLKDTCESLLSGVVSTHSVEQMIAAPFGPLWKDDSLKDQLHLRLDTSFDIFEKNFKQLYLATEELRKEMTIAPEEQVGSLPEKKRFKLELRRILFAIKSPKYEKTMKEISDANSVLKSLLESHSKVSKSRQARSQGKLFSVLRTVARNIFNALTLSFPCHCCSSHSLNLQLLAPFIVPYRNREALLKQQEFRIALSYNPQTKASQGYSSSWAWNEVALRAVEPQQPSDAFLPPPVVMKPQNSMQKLKKSVMFFENKRELLGSRSSSSSTSTILLPPPIVVPLTHQPEPLDLVNLCEELATRKRAGGDCYGYVTGQTNTDSHRFGVYSVDSCKDSGSWSMFSLKQLLETGVFDEEGPQLPKQLDIAATVASSVLHLHDTPWMPQVLTSEHVYFLERDGRLDYDRIYVTSSLAQPNSGSEVKTDLPMTRAIKNKTIFSLAALLMEIILCKTLDHLYAETKQPGQRVYAHPLLDKPAMESLLADVEAYASDEYRNTVTSCLRCNFRCPAFSLDDEAFREEVYSNIVGPLQEMASCMRKLS
ncbi:hypothetical protein F5Y18DRAFT_219260 [Xylariaceae sp. FL1019]|nr:hypothetical protein F5Y18DRAFT_219260 [Xylariaceae sp. FL1019]